MISKPKRPYRILGLSKNNKLTLFFPDAWCPGMFSGTVLLSLPPQTVAYKLELPVGSSDIGDLQQCVVNFTLCFPGTQTQGSERTSIPSPLSA